MRGLPAELRPDGGARATFVENLMLLNAAALVTASICMLRDQPVIGAIGVLFFGFGVVVMIRMRLERWGTFAADTLEPFGKRLRRGDPDGYGWLLRVLARPSWRRRGRADAALTFLAAHDTLRDGLLHHARHRDLDLAAFADRLTRQPADPLAAALASLHPDGRVRAHAVAAMTRAPHPGHAPFLVERAVEWVAEIRSAALAALHAYCAAHPEVDLTREYARISRRKHADGVAELIRSAEHAAAEERA